MRSLAFLILFFSAVAALAQCPPHVQATTALGSYTLTCNNPTLLAIGSSTTPDTEISWLVPSTPSLINTSTVVLGPPNGPATSTASFVYAQYTVVATNTALACSSSSVVQVNQNFSLPSFPTPTIIYSSSDGFCKINSKLTIASFTYATNGSPQFGYSWLGPNNQPIVWGYDSWGGVPQYPLLSAGIYTFNLHGLYSWCAKTDTFLVKDLRPHFSLLGISPSNSNTCNGYATLTPLSPEPYTLSINQGSLNGNTVSNLCYGWLKVCMTNTSTTCVKCDSLLINEATGIAEYEIPIGLHIYPNPATSRVMLTSSLDEPVFLRIYSCEGKLVNEFFIAGKHEISGLSEGLYFLEASYKNSIERKKLLILKN